MKVRSLLDKTIPFSFNLLFFLVPLVFFSKTSEVFELNKMLLTYIFTVLILAAWLIRMILQKKIIFRRTILDIPLLIFLCSQFISTILSIDSRTSFFGYYSRFHGGLLSLIVYSLLYWAYVSNMDWQKTKKAIFWLLSSAILVSFYAGLEHFGRSPSCLLITGKFNVDCWVQDVQTRVFATLGQPNWLATWLTALMPFGWYLILSTKHRSPTTVHCPLSTVHFSFALSSFFFLILLYTKSKSGFLGFLVADFVFWLGIGLLLIRKTKDLGNTLKKFFILHLAFLIIAATVGTPWTPSIKKLFNKQTSQQVQKTTSKQTLESQITPSADIRKIVWQGALDIWKNYPIFGTGVETFAFSYYQFRPLEHNLVSEWDFLYNKAHNEYLNIAANTGSVGLLAYAILIMASLFIIAKQISKSEFLISKQAKKTKYQLDQLEIRPIRNCLIVLLSGYFSILVSNFFGFSVVVVGLQFFLYPAMAATIAEQRTKNKEQRNKITGEQKILILFVLCAMSYALFAIAKFWYVDLFYAQGKRQNAQKELAKAFRQLTKTVKLSPKEPIYHDELAKTTSDLCLVFAQQDEATISGQFLQKAIDESNKAVSLSPRNVILQLSRAKIFLKLSSINPDYTLEALRVLKKTSTLAPTYVKIFYHLGLAYEQLGETQKAMEVLKKTIEMKTNYRNARFKLGLLYSEFAENEKAKEQFEYILKKISPEDEPCKQQLQKL